MELIGGILGGMFTMLALYVLIFLIGSTLYKTPDDLGGFDDLNKTTQDGEKQNNLPATANWMKST